MKLTRLQLATLIRDAKKDRFNLPSENDLTQYVAKHFSITPDDSLKEIMKKELNYYKRSGKAYGNNTIVLDTEMFKKSTNSEVQEPTLPIPPSPKRQKWENRRRTDEIWNAVEKLAEKENVKPSQLLGILLTRCDSSAVTDIGEMLWEDDLTHSSKLPMDSTLALYTDCRLGRETYTKQKKLFEGSGLYVLPPWKNLRKKQNELTPDVKDLPSPHTGVYFDLVPAVKITVERILGNLVQDDVNISSELKVKIKYGFDGSGSHSIYNQLNNVHTNNIILTMFTH